jgi:Zn-dependent protease
MGNPLSLRESTQAALVEEPTTEDPAPATYSFRTERVLNEAQDEARRAQSEHVDTTHLLLGLLDEGGAAAQILRRNGLDAQRLRYWARQPAAKLPEPVPTPITNTPPAPPSDLERKPLRQILLRLISWRAIGVMAAFMLAGGFLLTRADLTQMRIGLFMFVLTGWILSVCVHEFGHALVADLGGDHSVRTNGYLSFNPLKYTHPFLSVVMPVIFVLMGGIGLPGGAVYIDHSRLRNAKWESAVSFAGPLGSAMVALVCATPFVLGLNTLTSSRVSPEVWAALAMLVMFNIAGVLLNLLPIPPLDGFGIIAPWLTPSLRVTLYGLGSFGILLVFVLLNFNDNVNMFFWNTIFSIMRQIHVTPGMALLGLQYFMFWR